MAYDSQEIFGAVGALIFVIDAQVYWSNNDDCIGMIQGLIKKVDRTIIPKHCIAYFTQ